MNTILLTLECSVVLLVPFEEDEKDPSVWFLDHNYVEAMNDMFRKVNGTLQFLFAGYFQVIVLELHYSSEHEY
jgi:hypothetical protein